MLAKHISLTRGLAPLSRDEFLGLCRPFPLLEWDFGPVMEMKEDPDAKNYLFSRQHVPFHWDGAFHKTPSFLVFWCEEAPTPGAGGETLFCDTTKVWEAASPDDRARWSKISLTFETKKLAHYGGKFTTPLVDRHPRTGETILRFAEPVETALNPVSLEVEGADREEFLADMRSRVYDPRFCYRHRWKRGDLMVADNHALIHARTAFEKDCPRHLRRIQLL